MKKGNDRSDDRGNWLIGAMGLGHRCQHVFYHLVAVVAACIAAPWAWYHERIIHARGRSLTHEEFELSKKIGIRYPGRVKVMVVDHIPNPIRQYRHCFSDGLAKKWIADIGGITFRHGIYVTRQYADSVSLLAHELVHVRQYEEADSIWVFMREYIRQCLVLGYYNAPYEVEARRDAAAWLNPDC